MAQFLTLAMLGLGAGAAYTLVAQSVLVVYRGSAVLNFAQGAVAMTGGYMYYQFAVRDHWPFAPAFVVAVLVGAAIGVAVYIGPIRSLRNAANVASVIATLGVLVTLQAAFTLLYGTNGNFVPSFLPSKELHVGNVGIGENDLILLGIAVALTLALWLFYRFTTLGLATRAAATNRLSASALAWSPDALGMFNWGLGGALASAAGVLLAPLAGLQPGTTSLVIIVAVAAALVGNFSSFPLTLVGALVIGIGESLINNYVHQQGVEDALPLLILVALLVIRGRGLPVRSYVGERFSEVGSGRVRWQLLVPVVVVSVVLVVFVFSANIITALTTSLAYSMVMLSIVVLSGYAGQLSLAQIALGGVGALTAGRLVAAQGWPFELALLAGIAAAILIGLVFAIPALRTRGVSLAAVTLAMGFALQSTVFANIKYTGGVNGTVVTNERVLGINIDPVLHPAGYCILTLVLFVIVGLIVANVRRGRVGRRLLAVRTNERAASALGISVVGAKLYAFALSAGIAGLGGILIAFQNATIEWDSFDPFTSILLVAYVVIGSVGYITGPLLGSLLIAGGIASYLVSLILPGLSNWLALIGGLSLIQILVVSPNGLAEQHVVVFKTLFHKLRSHFAPAGRKPVASTGSQSGAVGPDTRSAKRRTVASTTLEVSDLVVRFGGVTAVNEVSLTVRTGQIAGVIGPNGAGKTTLIDAITGYVRPAAGEVRFGGQRIDGWSVAKRARAGISRSFQSLELFEDMSVSENLRTASDTRDRLAYLTNLVAPRNRPLTPGVLAAIGEFGLENFLDRRPTDISYGQRRLVAAARAVATEPSILLLDEPAAGLSDSETAELRELVRSLAKDWGMGIVLVEHDLAFVMDVCDEVTVLDFGRRIAQGPPEAVSVDLAVIAAYIGEPEVAEPLQAGELARESAT